jgi:O-acetyl-ADP-ribose deacetylase (regulator of RNase III)
MSAAAAEQAKEKYLSMKIEEKRELYKCEDKYVILDEVQSWDDYSTEAGLTPEEEADSKFPPSQSLNTKVSMWRGDITTLEIDAIVNAANNSLLGGGGVDGAIHRAAGRDLLQECKTLDGCETGEAKMTGGYKLPAKYVIHTVGPQGEKPDKLFQCYSNSLTLMLDNKLRTIAFPCISTGIYGYPSKKAAHVALKTVREFLEEHGAEVDRVIFCIFLPEDWEIYHKLMQQYFPVVPR